MIGEHESAFAYDWRARFGLPLEVVFDGRMSWAETWSLTVELAADPMSHVGAALGGLALPASFEAIILADVLDVLVAQAPRKKGTAPYPPYTRPWVGKATAGASGPVMSQDEIREALRDRGHDV